MAQGIPEPDLVMYGVVRDVGSEQPVRVTAGELVWKFRPTNGGQVFEVGVGLQNLNDQFSYVLQVPCETAIPGITPALGVLLLGSDYDRSEVTVSGVAAAFSQAGQQTFGLAATDRGRIERVDLLVSLDSSGALPDDWQIQYFGRVGVDPLDDPDGDGATNLDEYRAGTNPVDPESFFEVVVSELMPGGPRLEWTSATGRRYTVYRSSNLATGFEAIASGVTATPPVNSYQDNTAAGDAYFYRVRAEQQSP